MALNADRVARNSHLLVVEIIHKRCALCRLLRIQIAIVVRRRQRHLHTSDVVLRLFKANGLVLVPETTDNAASKVHQCSILEVQVVRLRRERVLAMPHGVAAFVDEDMVVALHSDAVGANGNGNGVFSFSIAHDGFAVGHASRAIHLKGTAVHGNRSAGIAYGAMHGEVTDVGEVHTTIH